MCNNEEFNKRVRSANYTEREKQLIFSLVLKHKNIIENKKTDSVSLEEKNRAWNSVAKQFNASSPGLIPRSTDSIKKFYDNKKKELRKEMAKERLEIYKTGGGPPPAKKKDNPLLSIVNEKSIYGLENKFDGDRLNIHQDVEEIRDFQPYLSNIELDDDVPMLNEVITIEKSPQLKDNNNEERKDDQIYEIRRKNINCEEIDAHQERENQETYGQPGGNRRCNTDRRRPATVVKALTSSNIAEKYDNLLDKRLHLCNYEMARIKNLIEMESQEKKLKIKALNLDVQIKKEQLKVLQENHIQDHT